MRPLAIYSFIPRRHTTSWYYRVQVPLETARDLGLNVRSLIDTDDAGITNEQHFSAFNGADVCLLYQPTGDAEIQKITVAQSFVPSKIDDGSWKHPPVIVVDSDDNLFAVDPHNSAFRTLGIRDPNGAGLEPGMAIGDIDESGRRTLLWHDGACRQQTCGGTEEAPCPKRIDLAGNKRTIQSYRDIIEMADAFTCTNHRILDAACKESVLLNGKVWPNLVRMDHYPQIDLVQDDSKVNILWAGGGAHRDDFFFIKDSIAEITNKYSNVHWIIWGALFPAVMDLIKPDRYTYMPWCDPREYKLRRVMVNEDISIAPLVDNKFNRCRSAIKLYEASVSKKPAATIAQNTGAYSDEIIDGQTGMLFSTPAEFTEKLSELIESRSKRVEIAANAKDWVSENRNALKEVPKWVAWLEEMVERQKVSYPHMSEHEWGEFVKQMEKESENGSVQSVNAPS